LRAEGSDALVRKRYASSKGKLHIEKDFTGIFNNVDEFSSRPTEFHLIGVDPG